jgi:hypothetical protein
VSGSGVEVGRNQIHGERERPGIRVRTVGATMHEAVNVRDNIVLEFGRAGIIVGPDNVSKNKLHQPLITGNTVDRQEPIPQGLIGIELTGHAVQWVDEIVDDNEIGAGIPIQIQGPGRAPSPWSARPSRFSVEKRPRALGRKESDGNTHGRLHHLARRLRCR